MAIQICRCRVSRSRVECCVSIAMTLDAGQPLLPKALIGWSVGERLQPVQAQLRVHNAHA